MISKKKIICASLIIGIVVGILSRDQIQFGILCGISLYTLFMVVCLTSNQTRKAKEITIKWFIPTMVSFFLTVILIGFFKMIE